MKWAQLNVYPTSKNGDFVIVLVENSGFHYHCARHEKIKCSMCVDTRKSRVLSTWRAYGDGEVDVYEVIRRALQMVTENDGSNYSRAFNIGPLPPRA